MAEPIRVGEKQVVWRHGKWVVYIQLAMGRVFIREFKTKQEAVDYKHRH